jgi:anti-anti-sigma factor
MSAAHAHPHAWSLHTALDRSSGVATLIVHGRIGNAGAVELHTALQNAVVAGETLILDLEGVDYLSSAGLAVLQDAARDSNEQGGRVELARASESVKMALRLAGPVPYLITAF